MYPLNLSVGTFVVFVSIVLMQAEGSLGAGSDTLSFELLEADAFSELAPPKRAAWTLEYRYSGGLAESSLFSGIRMSTVGNPEAVNDYLFLFHGDTPSYYDSSTQDRRTSTPIEVELWKLHLELSKAGEGLCVVQPMCAKQDWHSLFRFSATDFRAENMALEISSLYRHLCRHFPGNCRLHLHSFSGAGRVDRALHESLLSNDESFNGLRNGALKSWTVSDSMVNNAYAMEDKMKHKSIMAVSWAQFLRSFPSVPVTLIYDRSGEYSYMQGINLDVIRFYKDLNVNGSLTVEPSVKIVNGRTVMSDAASALKQLKAIEQTRDAVTLNSADTHLGTFLGKIAESYLEHRKRLRGK